VLSADPQEFAERPGQRANSADALIDDRPIANDEDAVDVLEVISRCATTIMVTPSISM
jgi:hypothetical protein